MTDLPDTPAAISAASKGDERLAFFLLAVVLAPALAIAIVGGWGFSIWILQMIFGPPTG